MQYRSTLTQTQDLPELLQRYEAKKAHLSAMYSLYTFFAITREKGWLRLKCSMKVVSNSSEKPSITAGRRACDQRNVCHIGNTALADRIGPCAHLSDRRDAACKPTSVWRFAKDLHLSLVRLARQMALEPIFVAALLLTHLTVPSQLL